MSVRSAIQQATRAAVSNQQEYVRLSEILISTPEPNDSAQVAEAQRKAKEVLQAIRHGGTFSDLAKANSQGPSAAQGGALGVFKRGDLAPSLEKVVFGMKAGDVSDVIRTKQGFVILQVTEHNSGVMKERQMGALDILSDTQGVDFGPYLKRVVSCLEMEKAFLR